MYLDDLSDPSGCTLVPNSVLDDDQLGPETRLVYIMLRRVAAIGHSRLIDQRDLAHRIGIPRTPDPATSRTAAAKRPHPPR